MVEMASVELPFAVVRIKPIFSSEYRRFRHLRHINRSQSFACVPLKPGYYRGAVMGIGLGLMSINALTVSQITLMCRQVDELIAAGVTLNLAIRTLETAVDSAAKNMVLGNASPHSARQVPLAQWSAAARAAYEESPSRPAKEYLRVEHGTPRRAFAKVVLEAARLDTLSDETFRALIRDRWKVAVITHEQDRRLPRSALMSTPDERWASVGIVF